jgi:hypothetical protein
MDTSALRGRLDQSLFQLTARLLDHLFGNLHFAALGVDDGARQVLRLADYFNLGIAAVLQGHGLSPHQVVYLL